MKPACRFALTFLAAAATVTVPRASTSSSPFPELSKLPAVPKKPDLLFAGTSVSNTELRLTLANTGSAAAGASKLSYSGSWADRGVYTFVSGTVAVPALDAGESHTVTIAYGTFLEHATVRMSAEADVDDDVSESNERNNTMSFTASF